MDLRCTSCLRTFHGLVSWGKNAQVRETIYQSFKPKLEKILDSTSSGTSNMLRGALSRCLVNKGLSGFGNCLVRGTLARISGLEIFDLLILVDTEMASSRSFDSRTSWEE